jgi:menaquinone-dependent protoporphyrinogen IX oxidase/CubicO group peptidase (beta-lactamase class C family)
VVRPLLKASVMKPFLIVYATREGQTQRVAEHVAVTLQAHGVAAQLANAAELDKDLDLSEFGLVVLAASVHMQKHEREMVEFVKKHRAALLGVPTVFLSTSLSQAAAENTLHTTEERARARADVERMIDGFFEATDFRPSSHKAIAGALVYTEYNWLIRLIMKQISKSEGASTDTSRDHEYTDWIDLDKFAEALVSGEMPVCSSDSPVPTVGTDNQHGAQDRGPVRHAGLHIEGTVNPGFEPVRRAFIENFTQRNELGGACCIYQNGEKVVDLWGGLTAHATRQPWQVDTMAIVHSTTKGLAAMVMALAHSRGWLDYDARVAEYWPEFSQQGKAEITVRQLLAHQAGLFGFAEHVDRGIIADPDRLAVIMARQRPEWPAGERQAYHAISLGFYESELIRRVDPAHRTLGQVFDQEIARPLGLDAYIRTPRSVPSARVTPLDPPSLWERLTGMPLSVLLSSLDRRSVLHRSLVANPGTQFYRRRAGGRTRVGSALGRRHHQRPRARQGLRSVRHGRARARVASRDVRSAQSRGHPTAAWILRRVSGRPSALLARLHETERVVSLRACGCLRCARCRRFDGLRGSGAAPRLRLHHESHGYAPARRPPRHRVARRHPRSAQLTAAARMPPTRSCTPAAGSNARGRSMFCKICGCDGKRRKARGAAPELQRLGSRGLVRGLRQARSQSASRLVPSEERSEIT